MSLRFKEARYWWNGAIMPLVYAVCPQFDIQVGRMYSKNDRKRITQQRILGIANFIF